MKGMVTRVAHAIFGKHPFEGADPGVQRAMIKRARNVINAMRYVDGMDEGIAIAVGNRRLGVDAVSAAEVHDAWIDAALQEKE
jgi:hypothetical protein